MNAFMAAVDWVDKITGAIEKLLGPILIVLCSVGTIYAVVVGVKMIKADSKDAREENKQRLINIAITIVAVLVLIAVFYGLKEIFTNNKDNPGEVAPDLGLGNSGK